MNSVRKLAKDFGVVREVANFLDTLSEQVEIAQLSAGVDVKKLAQTHHIKIPTSLRQANIVLADRHSDEETTRGLVIQLPPDRPVERTSPFKVRWSGKSCYTICYQPDPKQPPTCVMICIEKHVAAIQSA